MDTADCNRTCSPRVQLREPGMPRSQAARPGQWSAIKPPPPRTSGKYVQITTKPHFRALSKGLAGETQMVRLEKTTK